MSDVKYRASINNEDLPCVVGPGNGLGYHAHTLNPDLTCDTFEEAERAAKIAIIAHQEGYKLAQLDMQKVLGIEK